MQEFNFRKLNVQLTNTLPDHHGEFTCAVNYSRRYIVAITTVYYSIHAVVVVVIDEIRISGIVQYGVFVVYGSGQYCITQLPHNLHDDLIVRDAYADGLFLVPEYSGNIAACWKNKCIWAWKVTLENFMG